MNFHELLFQSGFFTNRSVHTALLVGGGAAIVSGIVGIFTVLRGQAFAGHALADISSAGGAAAFLIGINPLLGFLIMALVGGAGMEAFGVRTARERDLVTGVVTGAGLGVAALLLYLTVTTTSARGAAITVMFGSMFSIPGAIVPLALAVGLGALALAAVLYRPLLLASLDTGLARAQGIPTRLVGLAFLALLALAVALTAITVGAILATALLIGPAATALRLANRPGRALLLAPLIGLAATYVGILIAYDSYGWTGGHGWPVSFCIVSLILLAYLATSLPRRHGAPRPAIDIEA